MIRTIGLFSLILLISCCNNVGEDQQQVREKNVIIGEIGAFNNTPNVLGVSVSTGAISHSFGIVTQAGGAVKGFAELSVGEKLEVRWKETFPDGSRKSYTASFDSNELADIANQVKGLKFTYLGSQSWKLEAFKASHMKAPDRLKTIKSIESSMVKPKVSK